MNMEFQVSKDFQRCLDNLRFKYGEDFEYLNGIHPSQIDPFEFEKNFISARNVADSTIDSNANVGTKDIRSLQNEKTKAMDKLKAFSNQFEQMKEMFGLDVAKQWLEFEYSGLFYMNDAHTADQMPYCYAYDLTRLAKEGLFFFNNYNNQPPKHLTTFLDDVIEYISYMSNRSSGAVGIPNILIWTYYFWKHDCETGYFLKNPDYYLRQNFQKLVYRLNQPFIRVIQTAFTNVSIFDRPYIEALFGGVEYPDGSFVIDNIDNLIEHQKVFMEVISDIRTENGFTFPVLTYSLLKRSDLTVEDKAEMIAKRDFHMFVDEDFARWCSDHNTKWNDSNFFISEDVGTLSNCCFSGDQWLYYFDETGNKVFTTFKNLVESRLDDDKKNKDSRIQVVSKVTDNITVLDEYGNKISIAAVSRLPNKHNKIIELTLEDGSMLRVTPDQKIWDNASGKLVTAEAIMMNPEAYDI